jgi:hypothetical protein
VVNDHGLVSPLVSTTEPPVKVHGPTPFSNPESTRRLLPGDGHALAAVADGAAEQTVTSPKAKAFNAYRPNILYD